MRNLLIALACITAAGCAHGQIDQGRKGVTAAVGVFSAGVEGLESADEAIQKDLIDKFHRGEITADQAKDQYAAWSVKYDIAHTALTALWDALKGAANVLAAADAKLDADIPTAMGKLAAALGNALDALRNAGVKVPS